MVDLSIVMWLFTRGYLICRSICLSVCLFIYLPTSMYVYTVIYAHPVWESKYDNMMGIFYILRKWLDDHSHIRGFLKMWDPQVTIVVSTLKYWLGFWGYTSLSSQNIYPFILVSHWYFCGGVPWSKDGSCQKKEDGHLLESRFGMDEWSHKPCTSRASIRLDRGTMNWWERQMVWLIYLRTSERWTYHMDDPNDPWMFFTTTVFWDNCLNCAYRKSEETIQNFLSHNGEMPNGGGKWKLAKWW